MIIVCKTCGKEDNIDNYLNLSGEYKPLDKWHWPKCCGQFMEIKK